MAGRFQLDLKTFEVSSKTFNLSLSMTSRAFIYDTRLGNMPQDDISSLIRSKQLWLLPRGLCRLDVHVRMGECNISREERHGFLDSIADIVCQCPLWSQLGLDVHILDVQHHEEEGNIPNLYFGIEQPDMSSALLSPPHTHTAQLKGLECMFRFGSSSFSKPISKMEKQASSESPLFSSHMISSTGSQHVFDANDPTELWENVAYLVQAAFCITFGTRKGMRGLSVFEPENRPSLLDLAPAIWNARYRRSIASHTKHFAVISNIFASSLNGQSPELRRKGADLLKGAPTEPNQDSDQHVVRHLESSIQSMLWDLLQDTLKPTIGTINPTRKAVSLKAELDCQDSQINGTIVDEGRFEQYELSDKQLYLYGKLPSSSDRSNGHYQSHATCDLDLDLAWQEEIDHTVSLGGDQTLRISELSNRLGDFSSEADVTNSQLLGFQSQYFASGLSSPMQDYLMSDCMYDEEDDIYGYECDYVDHAGQGLNEYDLRAIATSSWEGDGERNTRWEATEKGIHSLDVQGESL
ncbi:hypothetical protein F5Y12DRAFT_628803 [Xylaria sp. FL1777]|nr:hypothetical protein F5Y12DRAFT_628803 [Xylaria sp. FL1777]